MVLGSPIATPARLPKMRERVLTCVHREEHIAHVGVRRADHHGNELCASAMNGQLLERLVLCSAPVNRALGQPWLAVRVVSNRIEPI